MADLIGRHLGQYEIIGLLGTGGMATVYRARQERMQREIAIKVITPDPFNAELFKRRFAREAQTIASLSHPHILKVFDYGQEGDIVYMVMEMLTGGTLAELIRQGPLSKMRAVQLFDQIASALTYAHEQQIVHRDLKPKNVLLDENGNSFLADFGIARLLLTDTATITEAGAALGTPAYMPPEQWRGEPVDGRADIYSLGVMLFEMLAGQRPFQSDLPLTLMYDHMSRMPPSLHRLRSGLPQHIDDIILKAIAKDPRDRYTSPAQMATAFRTMIQTQPSPSEASDLLVTITAQDLSADAPTPLTVTISALQAAQQARQAIARLNGTLGEPRSQAGTTSSKIINTPPQDVRARFKDRARQQADIVNRLLDRVPLVSIYGRGGIGKTALACKVLADLQHVPNSPDGLIYLSAARRDTTEKGISLDRIFRDFGKLLSGSAKEALEAAAHDPQLSAAQKIAVLLEQVQAGYYILLLDNLESLQDPDSFELTDPDLRVFVESVLEQSSGLSLLITSRLPLTLPRLLKTREYPVALDEGLPTDDAIELLRTFDLSGAAGLRDAPTERLRIIAERTRGFPRALEAVAGLLLEDSLYSLDDLLSNQDLFAEEIVSFIVRQAVERLPADALRVMEAVALFDRPISQVSLEFLLAPYIDVNPLRATLNRLTKTYFLSFNKADKTFVMHPIDQEYCYARIPIGSPADKPADKMGTPVYSRHALHYRAAEYYQRQRTPRADWQSLDDLTAHFAEFDHRVQAGDFDTAGALLFEFDFNYLLQAGYAARLTAMHERLQGKLTDARAVRSSLNNLGHGYAQLGRVAEGIRCWEQGLESARREADRTQEGVFLINLANAYQVLGQLEQAVSLYEQALTIHRGLSNRKHEAFTLGNLGVAYNSLGQFERAATFYQQAISIYRESKLRYEEAIFLGNLGETQLALGNNRQAVQTLRESLAIADDVRYPRGQSYFGGGLAAAYFLNGDLASAQQIISDAQAFNVPESNHTIALLHGFILLCLGQRDSAAQQLTKAIAQANELLSKTPELYDALYVRGLARAALGRPESAPAIQQDLQAARSICAAPGVVSAYGRLLDALIQRAESEPLKIARAALVA